MIYSTKSWQESLVPLLAFSPGGKPALLVPWGYGLEVAKLFDCIMFTCDPLPDPSAVGRPRPADPARIRADFDPAPDAARTPAGFPPLDPTSATLDG